MPFTKIKTNYPKYVPKNDKTEYRKQAWKKYSFELRSMNPFCADCTKQFKVRLLLVDHIIPVDKQGSFYDPKNHQILCFPCHNKKTNADKKQIQDFELNEEGKRIPKSK